MEVMKAQRTARQAKEKAELLEQEPHDMEESPAETACDLMSHGIVEPTTKVLKTTKEWITTFKDGTGDEACHVV